ncbi:MAG: MBL fold metallo-hydrolase [Candidatus Heimdallarchaeota archaeon]|nr:MAG: MBL fold metallo-hydrolase [Candidatus Heimdallarchaeota archaeon]
MINIQLGKITIRLVGSGQLSAPNDCCVYLVSDFEASILVDAGAGSKESIKAIIHNIKAILNLVQVEYILVTHAHIDHVGGLKDIKWNLPQAKIIAHTYAARVIENEDAILSAAKWYRTRLHSVDIDIKITQPFTVELAGGVFDVILTPGHTPGSVVGLLTTPKERVLFGQDIHGPFMPEFKSDIGQWRQSMEKILDLQPDYLCEGHFGIIKGKKNVEHFIKRYLGQYS